MTGETSREELDMSEHAVAVIDERVEGVAMRRAGMTPDGGLLLPSPDQLKTLQMFGEMYVASGLLPDGIKTWQAVAVIIQHGMDLGIPISTALQKISIIKGKPVCDAALMASLIYRDHGDDALRVVESTDEKATYAYKRRSWTDYEQYTYTIKDAERAKLTDKPGAGGGPGMWKTYPKSMLRARCLADIAHAQFQDTIGGLYLQDELDHLKGERTATITPLKPAEPADVVDVVARDTPQEKRLTDRQFGAEVRKAMAARDAGAFRKLVDDADSQTGRWIALVQAAESPQALDWIRRQIERKDVGNDLLEAEIAKRQEQLAGEPTDDEPMATKEQIQTIFDLGHALGMNDVEVRQYIGRPDNQVTASEAEQIRFELDEDLQRRMREHESAPAEQ